MDKSFRNRTEVVVNRRIYDAMDGSVRKKTYKFKNRKEVSKVEPMCLYENELKSFISLQNRTDGRTEGSKSGRKCLQTDITPT